MANNNKGRMTVEEAGRKGGESTSASHDRDFYSEIGRKGGQARGSNREQASDDY
jgi:general stress protein YciG